MLFDTPPWAILPVHLAELWGNISNSVKVCPNKGKEYSVLISVPTQLHPILQGTLRVPPEDTVWLYLEEVAGDGWYLHAQWQTGGMPGTDLWMYKNLPVWAERRYAV